LTYYDLLAHPNLFQMLTIFDRDVANLVHVKERCQCCGGKLDRANYQRSGYGMPAGAGDDVKCRFSFCCRECRRRMTPDSLRFLDGKAYPGVIVTLLAALQHGETDARFNALRKALGIDRRTLGHWRRWWRDYFAASAFWRGARGLLPATHLDASIPERLAAAFAAGCLPLDALEKLARFLAPWRRTRPK
jgi:hypothetical protein